MTEPTRTCLPPPTRLRAVLSDLDDTLFDHERATRAALSIVQEGHAPLQCWGLDELCVRHRSILEELHLEVLARRLTVDAARLERFRRLLAGTRLAGAEAAAERLAAAYRSAYETTWHPVRGAVELLGAFRAAGLAVVIVTNNSADEQRRKLDRCGLTPLVDTLVTSEEVGVAKPAAAIFHAALDRAGVRVDEAVMLGDAWASDIEGARAIGLRAVWFNPTRRAQLDPAVPTLHALEPLAEALTTILRVPGSLGP